ncbi:hypothetical protein DFJ73DRAFT_667313 [Zopfochytrium polystomum]|nr:hypothetical protein DFJ73DRAFT_667313 [Zopfochytrium polystomum]
MRKIVVDVPAALVNDDMHRMPDAGAGGDSPGSAAAGVLGVGPLMNQPRQQNQPYARPSDTRASEQAELVRRVVALENASAPEINKWNRARVVELFGRRPFDTGSPEVQVAVLTVKMDAMRRHLERNRKDTSTKRRLQAVQSKRMSMLKYLRRKNLPRFVETCRALGIAPELVTVTV